MAIGDGMVKEQGKVQVEKEENPQEPQMHLADALKCPKCITNQ